MKLILVDGSSYFFRAFHALPPLTNSKGKPTGAIYGVANMIRKLMKDYESKNIAVIFDAKGKTFRNDLYPQYKANRPPMPRDLYSQFEPLVKLLKAMGLPIIIESNVEADDVIGTLTYLACKQDMEVIISTGDKDMAQLVNPKVKLINTMSQVVLDEQAVAEKFGVYPDKIIDYLALIGDTVDNIPGINKCGPKTATKWLEKYGSLEGVIANAPEITGKIGQYLQDSLKQLPLNKKLVTIKTDCKLACAPQDLVITKSDPKLLQELYSEFEFKTWLKELVPAKSQLDVCQKFTTITTLEAFAKLLKKLQACEIFSFDTETTSLNTQDANLVGLALAINYNGAYYIPLAHLDETTPQLDLNKTLAALKPHLEEKKIIGQNLKYDYQIMLKYNITLKNIAFDTMLESYILNAISRHDLDSLALKFLGYKTQTFTELAGKGVKQKRFDEIPIAKAAHYAAEDAEITLQLHNKIYPQLDAKLKKVFHDIELPLIRVLGDIERRGVLVDLDKLATLGQSLKKRLKILRMEAVELAGHDFNLNSPKQLQEILYIEQNLPVLVKTPTGQPSTSEAVLQDLAYDYRLAALILEYRSLNKLVTTYVDALPKKVCATTNRIHTSYNQAVTATGRLSSSEPNLQNIPIRTAEGRLIRTAFIATKDHAIIAADYSQIELRIMAHFSDDASLIYAFENNLDVHKATAAEIFSCKLADVTSEQRRRAKAVNFGLIYGMSAFGLAKQLQIDRKEAQLYIDTYFNKYPKVLDYMEQTRKKAQKLGYVETFFGRRLYLPEINSQNKPRMRAAQRAAINAPLQGTAADIIKIAMCKLATSSPEIAMVMQVHDELVFEVPKACVAKAIPKIRAAMEQAAKLQVNLAVTIDVGQNWDEAH